MLVHYTEGRFIIKSVTCSGYSGQNKCTNLKQVATLEEIMFHKANILHKVCMAFQFRLLRNKPFKSRRHHKGTVYSTYQDRRVCLVSKLKYRMVLEKEEKQLMKIFDCL